MGECAQVAGIANFMRPPVAAGWRSVFPGPAVSIERVLAVAGQKQADGDSQFYIKVVTPSAAHVLEELNRKRVTVAPALGIRARTVME